MGRRCGRGLGAFAEARAFATGFYSRQHDTIDYVKSAALPNAYLPARLPRKYLVRRQSERVALCRRRIHNHLDSEKIADGAHCMDRPCTARRVRCTGLQSEYVFNYPVENIHASWTWRLGHDIVLANAVEIVQRYRQTVYPVWNATLTHDTGKLRPYLRLTSLSNTGYQEIAA